MENIIPKLKSAEAYPEYKLFVEFDDGIKVLLIYQNGKRNLFSLNGIMKIILKILK